METGFSESTKVLNLETKLASLEKSVKTLTEKLNSNFTQCSLAIQLDKRVAELEKPKSALEVKTEPKKDNIEKAKKSVRIIAYVTIVIFAFRLLFSIILSQDFKNYFGIFSLIFGILILIFGLICGFFLLKFKRWALISLIVIAIINIFGLVFLSISLGQFKFPFSQLAYLTLILYGYKSFKIIK